MQDKKKINKNTIEFVLCSLGMGLTLNYGEEVRLSSSRPLRV